MKQTVRVENPTPHRRYAVLRTTIQFEPGEYSAADWILEQVEPIQNHPDGTVAWADVRFPVWLEPDEVRQEELPRMPQASAAKAGLEQAKVAPFQFHANLNQLALLGTRMDLEHEDLRLNLLAGFEDVPERSGFLVQTFRSFGTVQGAYPPLNPTLTIELYALAPFLGWCLEWPEHTVSVKALRSAGSSLAVHVSGCKAVLRSAHCAKVEHGGETFKLLRDGTARGVLLYAGTGEGPPGEAEAVARTLAAERAGAVLVGDAP